ncbi:hypothetical protein COBT_001083 [Conglomerata obtusa]
MSSTESIEPVRNTNEDKKSKLQHKILVEKNKQLLKKNKKNNEEMEHLKKELAAYKHENKPKNNSNTHANKHEYIDNIDVEICTDINDSNQMLYDINYSKSQDIVKNINKNENTYFLLDESNLHNVGFNNALQKKPKVIIDLEEENEHLKLQIAALLNDRKPCEEYFNDTNDLINKYYYLLKIVKDLNNNLNKKAEENKRLKNIIEKTNLHFLPRFSKKRKIFEISFDEASVMNFDNIHKIKEKTVLQKNKEVIDKYNHIFSNWTNFISNYDRKVKIVNSKIEAILYMINKMQEKYLCIKNKQKILLHKNKLRVQKHCKETKKLVNTIDDLVDQKNRINNSFCSKIDQLENERSKLIEENRHIKQNLDLSECKNKEYIEKIDSFIALLDVINTDMEKLEEENIKLKEDINKYEAQI